MKLTGGEQQILAAIEDDLQTGDPALAQVFRNAPLPPARQRRPLSTGQRALLMLVPHLLIVAFSVTFFLGVGGLAIVTGLVVLLRTICVGLGAPRLSGRSRTHSGGPRR